MRLTQYMTGIMLALLMTFVSCQTEESAGEAASAEADATGPETVGVHLTAEQLELAGIKTGRPAKKEVSGFVECTGMIEVPPANLTSVYAPVKGFVRQVSHLPGDYVKKGERLTRLQHPEMIRLQRQLLESKSRLYALQKDFERKDTLATADAASQRALEQARAEFELEQSRYRGIRAELKLIGLPVKRIEKEGEIRANLNIYAPNSGYLTRVNINNGKLIAPEDLLFEIVDNRHLHLELQVFAKDIQRVQKGQRIAAHLSGNPERRLEGEVYLVGRQIDLETKTAPVHGHLDSSTEDLVFGHFVQGRIFTEPRMATVLPTSAVVRDGNQTFIFVKKGERFERRQVRLGRQEGDLFEVDSLPLGPREEMVLEGAYYVAGSK